MVKIACPSSCPHLKQHESFQRERQGIRYRDAWVKVNADLRERKEDLQRLLALECFLKEAADRVEGVSDADVAIAIAEVIPRLSPIELVRSASSPLGRLLWEGLAPSLQAGRLLREQVKEGLVRLAKLVETLRDPEAPRAFLQGLFAHQEAIFSEEPKEESRGLIITPDDLRRTF